MSIRSGGRLMCVREDHTNGRVEPVNAIVDPCRFESRAVGDRVLVCGADFYSDPILSPDGLRLAWLQWNHPNMPWDGTELWVADASPEGNAGAPRRVAGGRNESIFQPDWSPDGAAVFRVGPNRMVEPVPDGSGRSHERRDPRGARNGSRVWQAAMDIQPEHVCVHRGEPTRRHLLTGRTLERWRWSTWLQANSRRLTGRFRPSRASVRRHASCSSLAALP